MMQANELINKLRERGQSVATAESCSGGLLAAAITDIAGASDVFSCGLVTYSNEMKTWLLDVPASTIATYNAVSEQTARAMALGLHRVSGANLALATTGVAGPGGGSAEKPVGLVYIAASYRDDLRVLRCQFQGDRAAVRKQTVEQALLLGLQLLNEHKEN